MRRTATARPTVPCGPQSGTVVAGGLAEIAWQRDIRVGEQCLVEDGGELPKATVDLLGHLRQPLVQLSLPALMSTHFLS